MMCSTLYLTTVSGSVMKATEAEHLNESVCEIAKPHDSIPGHLTCCSARGKFIPSLEQMVSSTEAPCN